MKNWVTICLIFLSFPFLGEAVAFHTVIVADTYARMVGSDIAWSVDTDFHSVRNETHKIAIKSGMELKEHLCIDQGGSARHVLRTIRSLEVEPEDVLFFYFSGHGIRTEKGIDDPWPTLNFGVDRKRVAFSSVIKLLEAKHPRLLIALSDACNHLMPEDYAPPEILITRAAYRQIAQEKEEVTGVHQLFLKMKGSVLACAAKPDSASYSGPKNGGLFTHYFFQSLHAEVATAQNPSWKAILDRVAILTSDLQEPFYVVNERAQLVESKN